MKLHHGCVKFLLALFLVGIFSGDLFAVSASNRSKASELYSQGNADFKKERYGEALKNFEQGYKLYQHSAIAYAISRTFAIFQDFKKTEKYTNLALRGSPKLKGVSKRDASILKKWAKTQAKRQFKMSAKADGPYVTPPRTAQPGSLNQGN